MAINDLYSTRQRRSRGTLSDVYLYDNIPKSLRIQAIQLIEEIIGPLNRDHCYGANLYAHIHKALCREYGVFSLNRASLYDGTAISHFITNEPDYERCLDAIELTFRHIDVTVRENTKIYGCSSGEIDDAINELNYRFKEAGVGYQFESGEIIRVDSQFVHSQAVKPILQILGSNPSYEGANDEFLSAHEHYRHQQYKECLNDCLKSFESLMKAIHVKHGWEFNQTDTAKKLINGCLVNGLIPEYMQEQFSSFKSLLVSGIPTIRNKEGGHGQGPEISTVPEHLASYALHLTASNLLFLAKCEEQL
ncbi:STM4504/CBY_0614 family protein [Pantoea eucalypti]|uniref:STM4504/CBY_0614 family protein n=1 Tax=Pantoea eucalypti TaxID=470933 RepID=UPI003FA43DA3